eukprot:scaffold55944_cov56-Phaeocystis_antarctica.AAC.2
MSARCLSSQRSKYDAAALAVFMGSSGPGELGEWDDVFGITTSGIRKSLDRTNRSHSLLDIPALRPYRSSQGVSTAEGTIHMQIRSSVTPNTMSWGWTSTTATTWPKGGAETCA